MKKYDFLMFIDDDEATNVYHQIVLNTSEMCDQYVFYNSPFKALEYLNQAQKDSSMKMPDAIFLDINMPKMDGWQFLDAYQKMGFDQLTAVVMLTTSLNIYDKKKAEQYELVLQMVNKPLSETVLQDLHDDIFNQH